MNLIRKHKISQVTGITLNGTDKEIIDFIQDKLSGLMPFKHDDYPDSIFYMKDDKIFLEQDSKNDRLWCKYDDFWKDLIYKYDMNMIDIQTTIKYMVEQAFKQRVGTPLIYERSFVKKVEQAFKQRVGTPFCNFPGTYCRWKML